MGVYVEGLGSGLGSTADNIVQSGWAVANDRAASAYGLAAAWLGVITGQTIPFSAATAGFTAPAIGYTLSLPTAPIAPTVSFPTLSAPDPLTLSTVAPVTPAVTPTFTATVPTVQILDKPSALSAIAPGAAPSVHDVTLPASPTIVLPDAPAMELISLPTAPTLNLPVWTGIAPDGSSLVTPTVGFAWSEEFYDSTLLQGVTNRLTTMLLGGTGLPVAIEQAIWDRGRAREDIAAIKATQETYEEFSSRGFSLPTGPLAGRVAEVWQKNHEAASTYSRDVAVKQAELEIENLKFTVSTGIQLEGQMLTYSGQFAQRALDAARTTVEVAINIFNAQVALYNARLQAYQTEASVFKDLIQAESLRLDQYRTEIEAQKLIGEINIQSIQIYKTRIDALMSAVELYKAQLEGVKTSVEVDRVRIEGFRSTVDAYKATVEAKTSEYQAWAESIRGEVAKVSVYEAQARSYGTLVDAYKAGETVKIENMRSQIDNNDMLIKAFGAKVGYLSEQIRAGVAQVDTTVRAFDGQTRLFGAQISGEQARVQALAEQIRLIIAAGTADADLKLKAADINIHQLLAIAQTEQEGRKAAGAVAGQLAASAMSAFHLQAGVSSSFGVGIQNNLNEGHNFSS